ncbi:translation initiation factor IF-2 [Alkaliphilus peptidifermentans]|uniref:Translation initiation factor IF-2 n=1 Tax=Alkaliphilus peptidifermentans DSM 18978 TaxID=1120976 RepID=A0A1G5DCV2_9FIRM|nr:translation initiation factor IF-2 [Alkaliphilus peptidifermentans]SCY12444.1 bacterial translation initiation factor 2 (bIF-2) [Alkaliphilus peptidifermentans DSM 18978]
MSKLRVYQLAKELGISSKELIEKLAELAVEVNNHMSTLEDEEAKLIKEIFTDNVKNSESNKTKDSSEKANEVKKEEPKNPNKKPMNQSKHNNKNNNNNNNNNNSKNSNNSKNNNPRKNDHRQQKQHTTENEVVKEDGDVQVKTIEINDKIIVKDFAELVKKSINEVITKLIQVGVMAAMNQEIDFETAEKVAEGFGFEVKRKEAVVVEDIEDIAIIEDDPKDLKPRPPVVTVMGHVDHGKTSLLDAIRETKVTAKEAGGITQHIGASEVKINGKKIVFLDTPGHEAFTAMRARGAKATDIAILVVAADDGVMPQTIEAINHAKAANVPIIVAINKIDKPGSNPDRVKQELSDHGILIEEWGGDIISVAVSALEGTNIDELLEMILLVAEVEEFKANPNRNAVGVVIEAQLDKGRGSVATVLVQNGTLNVGDSVVIGNTYGRIRAMVNDKGKRVKSANPSTAVEITGLNDVPKAGDQMVAVADDKIARNIAEGRINKIKEDQLKASQKISLDALYSQMQEGSIKELNIIVKADVQGSVEAVKQSLNKLSNDKVVIKPIHGGVGAITETDVMLASASNAIIIGFNVRPTSGATSLASKEAVDLRTYRIIYNAIEDIEAAMKGMLDPEFKEVELGKAQVRATFKVPGAGVVAGCYVIEGKILRNASIRLVRDGIVYHEGTISSLRRFKDDVKEVATGYECGIGIDHYNDVKDGDIIEAYKMQEIER